MALNGQHHGVAVWSGVASFFGALLAIGIFDLFGTPKWWNLIGALITAFVTAGAVYAQERLKDAKRQTGGDPGQPDLQVSDQPTQEGD